VFAVCPTIILQHGSSRPGGAIYDLYQIDEQRNKIELAQNFPQDYLSQALRLESGVIIPAEELQTRLLEVIQSSTDIPPQSPGFGNSQSF
jgi:hypothetical protein